MAFDAVITDEVFDPEAALASFRAVVSTAGAVVSFTGIVRGEADLLILSHYPEFTEAEIARIGAQAEKRWPLTGCKIIHRVGEMRPEEVIVFVAAASAHRRDAFEAVDFIMDFLKSEAPFWKQEQRGGERRWIEPRAQDGCDLKRWNA